MQLFNIRKTFQYTINASNNQILVQYLQVTNETFLPFDEERYSLVRADGTIRH